jgi:hypothetical protein
MGVKSKTLVQISPRVRIERGPVVKEAEATEALLDDRVTADHYKVTPKDPETGDFPRDKHGNVKGPKDAIGRPIELGKPMRYLDWKGQHAWKVYMWVDNEDHPQGGWYVYQHEHRDYETAVAEATKLAVKEGDL